MSDPVRVVSEFLDTVSQGADGFARAADAWFTPQTVWENVGMSTTTGPEQALGLMANMAAGGIHSIRIETLSIAAQGRKVLTERIDYMLDADGATKLPVRCMGVFEVSEDGKITRWADYFDTALFRPAS
jgi:limonene-1,2-epoxide hydrolase